MKNGQAFDALRAQPNEISPESYVFSPHPAYHEYLKIHKIFVGPATAKKLEDISEILSREMLPRYLSVAGWAAAEASLAQPQRSAEYRNRLLQKAETYWLQALETQLGWNHDRPDNLVEHSASYRYALDLAHLPLLQALVSGDLTQSVRFDVARDVLNIAEANAVQMSLAAKAGDRLAVSDHVGIGHECNGLLAFHSFDSPSLIAIPSTARADSGHYHPHQTHDLLIIQQKWGTILDTTPAEIKAKASQHDRKRYKALLVRGKIHLAIEGHHSPEHTLKAFSAYFNCSQSPKERQITDHARQTISDLYWLYKKGAPLKDFAANSNSGTYRDASLLQTQHPEIAPSY